MGKKDYIGGGIFTTLGIVVWMLTFRFPSLTDGNIRHPGPSLFPRVLASLFILFGSILILQSARSRAGEPGPSDDAAAVKPNYFNPALVVVLTLAFVFLTPKMGFLVTGTAILTILMTKLGVLLRKSFVISAALCCFVYFMFVTVMRVPLPRGLLGW